MAHHPTLPFIIATTGAGTLVVTTGNRIVAKTTLPVSHMGTDKDAGWECLRGSWYSFAVDDTAITHYIAAGSSSGMACVYSFNPETHELSLVSTCDVSIDDDGGESEIKDELSPQIYACQMITPITLMTASDDTITIWNIVPKDGDETLAGSRLKQYAFDSLGYGTIGGGRNPHDLIYIFDASYNQTFDLIAVGLSDGTTRLIERETGECKAIVSIPLDKCYVTSVSFTSSTTYVCTYNTGHTVLYMLSKEVSAHSIEEYTVTSGVISVLGDETADSAVFGAVAAPGLTADEGFLVSYSNDGHLRVYRVGEGRLVHDGSVPPAVRIKASGGEVYACVARLDREEKKLVVYAGGNMEGEGSFMGESIRVFKIDLS
jgi:WD40 repeat protein